MKKWSAVTVGVVLFVLLGGAGCSTSQPYTGTGAPRLHFIGDSITVLATPDINARYTSYDVAIDALTGATTFAQQANVIAAASLAPSVAVINLGTNDALRIDAPWTWVINGQLTVLEPQTTLGEVRDRLDQFEAAFPSNTCVVFVTVNSHIPTWAPSNAAAINQHIRTFDHVADWDAAWQANWFAGPDDPHPTSAGKQALLNLIDQEIVGC